MIRVIHTGDLHLDEPFAYLAAPKRAIKKQAIKSTLTQIIELTLEKQADVLIVAGDLFNNPNPLPETVAFAIEQFSRVTGQVQVVIVPGNHDIYQPGGIWDQPDWPENVMLFRDNSWAIQKLEASGITVAGIACHAAGDEKNVLKDLKVSAEIGVMHGAHKLGFYEGLHSYPFSEADTADLPVQYLALGHYHNFGRVGQSVAYYCGSPESLCFDESPRRSVTLIEMGDGPVRVRQLNLGQYGFRRHDIDCTIMSNPHEVETAIAALGGPKDLVKVVLKGTPSLDLNVDIEALIAVLEEKFFYLDIRDSLEMPASEIRSEERTIRAKFLTRMQERTIATDDVDEKSVINLATRLGLAALEGRLQK